MTERVAAIVPCLNGASSLAATILALRRQTVPVAKVVVVDDGSTDATAEVASSCGATVIQHPRNRGLSAARNTGILSCQTDLVACVDADVIPARDWLERLLPKFGDPKVALAGGKLVEMHRERPPDRWRTMHMQMDYGDEPLKIDKHAPARLSGFATVARRHALEAVGFYDLRFGRSYEDVDISMRLIDRGYTLVYVPGALCYHNRRDDVRSLLESSWSWAFWPSLFAGEYESCWAVAKKIRGHFSACRKLAGEHLKRRDPSLVFVDASLFVCSAFWDVRYYLSRRLPRSPAWLGRCDLGNIGNESPAPAARGQESRR